MPVEQRKAGRWRRERQNTGTKIAERAPQDEEIRARWAWVETEVWTERMLATLETGIEGHRWPNAYFTTMGLFSLRQAHQVACQSS